MHDGSTFSIMHPLTSTKKRHSIRVGQETGAAQWPSPPTAATHLVECAAITASGQTCGKPETGGGEIRSGEEILPEVDHDVSRKVGGLSRQALIAALLEAELARTEAEEACAARDQFLAAVSHELRTPLTPVLMAAHLLAQNPEVPVSAREALDMIERNLRIEARLVDDLLDFTRVHCGKLEVSCEAVDVHEVISHALEVTSDDVTRKNQQVTVELGGELPRGQRRRHPAATGVLEPAQKRLQVHAARRQHSRLFARRRRPIDRACHRLGHRLRAGAGFTAF